MYVSIYLSIYIYIYIYMYGGGLAPKLSEDGLELVLLQRVADLGPRVVALPLLQQEFIK